LAQITVVQKQITGRSKEKRQGGALKPKRINKTFERNSRG